MKYALIGLGMMSVIGFPAFAQDTAQPADQSKEPRMVSPAETHMKGDLAKMEARMSKLLEEREALNTEITALQKKMDAEQDSVNKLEK